MSEIKTAYFTNEALAKFVSVQGKQVSKIICHLWQNNNNPSESIEIIDNVQLQFFDNQKITISCNENGDGLDVIEYNFEEAKKNLQDVFNGKIKLFAVDASNTKMWQDVITKNLDLVKVTKQETYYKADSIVLQFENEMREISISPLDGLIIDFYEE